MQCIKVLYLKHFDVMHEMLKQYTVLKFFSKMMQSTSSNLEVTQYMIGFMCESRACSLCYGQYISTLVCSKVK